MEVFIHGEVPCIISWESENRVGFKKICPNRSLLRRFLESTSSILTVEIIILWLLMVLERFTHGVVEVQNLIKVNVGMEILLM